MGHITPLGRSNRKGVMTKVVQLDEIFRMTPILPSNIDFSKKSIIRGNPNFEGAYHPLSLSNRKVVNRKVVQLDEIFRLTPILPSNIDFSKKSIIRGNPNFKGAYHPPRLVKSKSGNYKSCSARRDLSIDTNIAG